MFKVTPQESVARNRLVLIASSDEESVEKWKSLFREMNCPVIVEDNPQDAEQSAKILWPSLILLDLVIAHHERLELCRRLKAAGGGILLLLSPMEDAPAIFEYIQAGVDEHITTPVNPMTLAVKSTAWLIRRRWSASLYSFNHSLA